MINNDKLIDDYMKRVSENSKSSNTRYQYSYVDLETVIDNPDEYIIPWCLPACKVLWDKNIETFMVSNYEDSNLYVLLWNLSDDNKLLIETWMKSDSRFVFSDYRGAFGIQVNGKDDVSSRELLFLASLFKMQDTLRFKSSEKFLEEFKTTGGEMRVNEYGHIIRLENPELSNISLEEALIRENKEQLYVSEEDRVYESAMYLHWHQRYLQYLKDNELTQGLNEVVQGVNSNRSFRL